MPVATRTCTLWRGERLWSREPGELSLACDHSFRWQARFAFSLGWLETVCRHRGTIEIVDGSSDTNRSSSKEKSLRIFSNSSVRFIFSPFLPLIFISIFLF